MGWLRTLYETYENNAHMVGKCDGSENVPLAPVGFIPQKANLEISVDRDGNFAGVEEVEKDEAWTLIPVTEKSSIRTSGACAHPLCDKIEYCAKGQNDKKFALYLEELEKWVQSKYTHPIVEAVYKYCKTGTMLSDLRNAGISVSNGAFVRWNVVGVGKCYEDDTLFDSFARYRKATEEGAEDTDYVTGARMRTTENHAKGVVKSAYNAKLISANDSEGFTYRGRFVDSGQAVSIGYEVSHKAHAALRWLADRQGVYMGGNTYIAWNSLGKDVPKADFRLNLDDDAEEDEQKSYTQEEYRVRLRNALSGYKQALEPTDGVQIIGLKAATTGRLSITYYGELTGSDYLDRIDKWYDECSWYLRTGSAHKVRNPTIKEIVDFAFGTEQGQWVKADDKVHGEQSQRLMRCIAERAVVPYDVVSALVVKAARRQSYAPANYERLLSVTCALLRKHKIDTQKEEISMQLNEAETDRSYLFGRLLAVLEKAERDTYDREEKREPSAIRLQSVFTNRPLDTFKVIHDALNPYFAQLPPPSRAYYKKLIGDIVCAIDDPESANLPLESNYLFGYYLQRKALYTKNKNNDSEE